MDVLAGFLEGLGLLIPVALGFPGPRPPFDFLEEDFKRLFFPIMYVRDASYWQRKVDVDGDGILKDWVTELLCRVGR